MKVIYADGTPGDLPDLPWLSIIEPVPGPITQAFGVRSITGILHKGEDRAPGKGPPIHAVRGGRVSFLRTGSWPHYGPLPADYKGVDTSYGGYGNQITLDHERTVQSHYAHLSATLVNEGDYVVEGTVIGYVGSTGISTGDHLHYEMRFTDDTRFDPEPYYTKPPEEDDMAEFTDYEKAALHRLAALEIDGKTFAPGTPGRTALIKIMDAYHALPDDASRQRFDKRVTALVRTLGLDQDGINALPTPRYGTLKPWTKDLQERVQEP